MALPGLAPPSIGTAGGGQAQQNIIRTLFDYNPLAVLRDIHERHVTVSDFRLILKTLGMSRGVDAPTTGHYERDWMRGNIKIGSINTASAGVGTNIVFTLDAVSMFNAGATLGGAARQSSEIKKGDWIISANNVIGHVILKDESFTPHRITIRPLRTTVDLAGEFVAAGEYPIVSNAWAEGTGLPLGSISRITKYTNEFQIIKQGGSSTGTELSNRLFVKFTQMEGGDGIFAEMNSRMWALYEHDFSHALLIGQSANNLTDTVNLSGLDAPILGTEGLIPWINSNGHTHIINPAAYTLADFDNIARTLWSERAGVNEVMTLDGFDMFKITENLLLAQSGTDLTPYILKKMTDKFAPLSDDDLQPFKESDFSLYVGFKALRKSGITFMFKQMQEFSDIKGLGMEGFDYQNSRVVLPIGEIVDSRTGNKGFMWGYEYKQKDSYSREVQTDSFGGVGTSGAPGGVGRAVNQYDAIQWGVLSEIAGHYACPNKCIWQKQA